MARVLTFSRTFPAYHPKKGLSTHFVERIISGFCPEGVESENEYFEMYCELVDDLQLTGLSNTPKYHTIRAGNRWKVGDKFNPRVWSGKPYNSKQIQFAPDMEVKKIWNFKIKKSDYFINGKELNLSDISEIAKNDGLSADDFELWFAPYTKKGTIECQIICWNENINY